MSGQRRRGPMGGHGPGMRPTEKAKDFKGSMGKMCIRDRELQV